MGPMYLPGQPSNAALSTSNAVLELSRVPLAGTQPLSCSISHVQSTIDIIFDTIEPNLVRRIVTCASDELALDDEDVGAALLFRLRRVERVVLTVRELCMPA